MATIAAADEKHFREWLDRVEIRPGGSGPHPVESVPANFIRRAVIAHIEGERSLHSGLEARNTTFTGDLLLGNLEVGFPLYFIGCMFEGAIFGSEAKTKTLSFTNSVLKKGADLRNTQVSGHVFMRGGFEAFGPVLMRDARIGGTLDLRGARFLYAGDAAGDPYKRGAQGEALGLSRCEATALMWETTPPADMGTHDVAIPAKPAAVVNLRDAKVRAFRHDMVQHKLAAWPEKGKLKLDGFEYDSIDLAPCNTFLDWLGLQAEHRPAPFFQLASAVEKHGRKDDARELRARVRKNEVAAYAEPKRTLARLFFWPVDYGASPVRAIYLAIPLFGLFWLAVAGLDSKGWMIVPADGLMSNDCYYGRSECKQPGWRRVSGEGGAVRWVPQDYPALSPLEYSLEAFVPVLDLGQQKHWEPAHSAVRIAFKLTAMLGIFFVGLFAAAVAGLLRPRDS